MPSCHSRTPTPIFVVVSVCVWCKILTVGRDGAGSGERLTESTPEEHFVNHCERRRRVREDVWRGAGSAIEGEAVYIDSSESKRAVGVDCCAAFHSACWDGTCFVKLNKCAGIDARRVSRVCAKTPTSGTPSTCWRFLFSIHSHHILQTSC
jgi:hypothetical protein